jgi:hypothetical protein
VNPETNQPAPPTTCAYLKAIQMNEEIGHDIKNFDRRGYLFGKIQERKKGVRICL